MVEGGGMKCIKFLMFTFNAIIWLAGAALLGLGIWIRLDRDTFDPLLGSAIYEIAGYTMIGAGALVFIMGFCGCCGAVKESRCLLATYFGMLVFLFCVEIAASVLAYFYHDQVRSLVGAQMNTTMATQYGLKEYAAVTTAVDKMQQMLLCCGYLEYQDWQNSIYYNAPVSSLSTNSTGTAVPRSCCKDQFISGCNYGYPGHPDDKTKIFGETEDGCLPALEQWIKANILIIGGVLLSIGVIQLVGMVFSCCLWKSISDDKVHPWSDMH